VFIVVYSAPEPVLDPESTEIARFFDGCDLIDPGLAPISQWRANAEPHPAQNPPYTAR
jgi:hypothetical protein